jgi:hypothetical protein
VYLFVEDSVFTKQNRTWTQDGGSCYGSLLTMLLVRRHILGGEGASYHNSRLGTRKVCDIDKEESSTGIEEDDTTRMMTASRATHMLS